MSDADGTVPEDRPEFALGYESVTEEHRDVSLPVEGSLPSWLSGTFLRNGPGRFEVGDRSVDHWFDGLAMLRRFEVDGAAGTVSYTNRFLRTDAYEAAREGEFGAQGFAATPDRGPFERLRAAFSIDPTDNTNADVAHVAGEFVALTESPRAVAFDPGTLATRGHLRWEDDLPVGHTTPHLRRDPERGETLGYLTAFLPESAYHVFRVPEGRQRREVIARIPVENPAYMHSFAATTDHVVLTEMPLVLPPRRLLWPDDEPLLRKYEWRPQQLTRFLVVERSTGEVVAQHRVPPFVVFHHAGARRRGDHLLVDLVAFDSPSVLNGLYLDRLRSGAGDGQGGQLRRYRLPLEGGPPDSETVATDLAMPRTPGRGVDDDSGYVYAQATTGDGPPRGLARVNVETGERDEWPAAQGFPGEPVFVANPDGDPGTETGVDGVLLVEVLVPDRERSELVVLDAAEMTELARAPAPHAIPFGFHGQFFPE